MLARCIFELQVSQGFCNHMGNMHGGAVATLADMSTTMATAPISNKDFWEFGGVSRSLNVTYLQPILQGMVLRIECMLRSVGKRLCECFKPSPLMLLQIDFLIQMPQL